MKDIVPELLEKIREEYRQEIKKSKGLRAFADKAKKGAADYKDAAEAARELGGILAQVYQNDLSSEVLPDGKMYYNIASRILEPTLREVYDISANCGEVVQGILNAKAGLGLKAQKAVIDQDNIDGIINRISSEEYFDDVKWITDAPVRNLIQKSIDETVKRNTDFQHKAGLSPKIVRKSSGHCCKWCDQVAGTYTYPDVPKDVFRRHDNCDCVVEYDPGDGKRQNVHTKKWRTQAESEKIEERKSIGYEKKIKGEDVTRQYINNAKPNKGKIIIEKDYDRKVHEEEIETAKFLHNILGGDIVLLPEINEDKVKTADYIWNEKYWDLKSTSTAKAANSAIRHGIKQIRENPGGVILNYGKNKMELEEVIEVIEKRMQWCNLSQVDIMIIYQNEIKKILRYK